MYNVVLENEQIGKSLLKNGRLQKPATFIPLNKINPYLLNQRVLAAAKRIGGSNNVWWAKDLVRCDRHFEPAINYLFGSSLICRDLDIANKVTTKYGLGCPRADIFKNINFDTDFSGSFFNVETGKN